MSKDKPEVDFRGISNSVRDELLLIRKKLTPEQAMKIVTAGMFLAA